MKMDQLAQTAMDAVADGRVKIIPERYAKSYLDWLGEKRDWPVSRQLWWGHQLPVWGLSRRLTEPAVTQRLAKRRVEIQPRIDQWVKDGRLAETRRESSLTSEEQQADVHNPEVTYYYLCVRDEKDIEIRRSVRERRSLRARG